MLGFKDKVAVVTGGARGIGKCIREEFEQAGAKVAVVIKSAFAQDMLDGAVGLGEQNCGVLDAYLIDLGNEGHTEALVHYIIDLSLTDAHFFGEVAYPYIVRQRVCVNVGIDRVALKIVILQIVCGIYLAHIVWREPQKIGHQRAAERAYVADVACALLSELV